MMSHRTTVRVFASVFAATVVLVGCAPAPGETAATPPGSAQRWEAVAGDEGSALVLLGEGDRQVIHLACLNNPARLQVLADGFTVSGQVILMVISAIVLSGLFFLVFERTVAGKALRATAVNRIGARLVGIRPARTAMLAYGCASLLAGLIGVLIAPVTTMYYDSGFIIGLKAFVAAIIGGLVSYPLTAIASFWSGALKDVIVFSLLIPVLMLRSYLMPQADEDEEEVDE